MTTYQLFPTLDPATKSALTESIRRWGVVVPIVIDQNGQIIDGHHRHTIADELGIDCPVEQVTVDSDEDAAELAVSLNVDRRHMGIDQRREIVAHLRSEGHSLRAIAGAVGVSQVTVRNDLIVNPLTMPDRINTSDGRTYPATRPAKDVHVGDTVIDDEGQERIVEIVERTVTLHDDQGDAVILDPESPVEVVEDKSFGMVKVDLDGSGLSHPARYPIGLLPLLAEAVPPDQFNRVLDPFAGTGRIHDLPNETTGVEIEPEWAELHPNTLVGDATNLPFHDGEFDAIVTSPTYGNRLADTYDAPDPENRHSYRIDLGRDLTDGSSAGLQWGDAYRDLHRLAWAEAVRVLRPGGRFVLNIKDHIRGGQRQHVAGWHVNKLMHAHGLRLLYCLDYRTRGLPAVDKGYSLAEQVFVLEKP